MSRNDFDHLAANTVVERLAAETARRQALEQDLEKLRTEFAGMVQQQGESNFRRHNQFEKLTERAEAAERLLAERTQERDDAKFEILRLENKMKWLVVERDALRTESLTKKWEREFER